MRVFVKLVIVCALTFPFFWCLWMLSTKDGSWWNIAAAVSLFLVVGYVVEWPWKDKQ